MTTAQTRFIDALAVKTEAAPILSNLSLEELVRFQLRLARIMQEYGPAICEQWNVSYPRAMGFASALEELE